MIPRLHIRRAVAYVVAVFLLIGMAAIWISIKGPSLHIMVNRGSCSDMLVEALLALRSYAEGNQGMLPYSNLGGENALLHAGLSERMASRVNYTNEPLALSEMSPATVILSCRPGIRAFGDKVYVATADGKVFLISEDKVRLGGVLDEDEGELRLKVFRK